MSFFFKNISKSYNSAITKRPLLVNMITTGVSKLVS